MSSQVSIIKCGSYDRELVSQKVKEAIGLLGGITAFIKPGSRVLVKPNLLMPIEPESGVDTHPEVVRAVVRLLKEINCKVFVGDGPCALKDIPQKIDEVYERSGMKAMCAEEGVSLVNFEQKRWRGERFPLAAFLDECDHLVSVPKFKTHNIMVLTGAIKNLYGLVWNIHKIELHKKYYRFEDFARTLVDIYQEVGPALTVVDAIVAMEGDGPAVSGKLRSEGLVIAGADCVAVDSVLATLMGLKPTDILSTKEAYGRKLGEAGLDAIIIKGERLKDVTGRPFILPSAASFRVKLLGMPFVRSLKKMVRYYPYVDRAKCNRCATCVKGCPNKIISMRSGGITFDYARCISCFCCQEFCPQGAIRVKKNWFAKLMNV